VFGQLMLARIIEPASKLDSLRVLARPVFRRHRTRRSTAACRGLAKESWQQHPAAACDAHALRRSCRLVPDQHGVSSPATTAFQVRAGPFMASHPLVNRRQNVAIGLTGLPDVPAKRTGATARWKSHWPSSAAVVAHTSRSQLSSSHRPIATRLTA
jgi:hypothetical protein